MNTLFNILYLLSFVTPALAPMLYRNLRPSMTAFYRDMTMRGTFRRLYTRLLTLYLITFHFYHLSVFGHPLWLMPSTVITAMLFFPGLCVRILHYLQRRRTLVTFCCISFLCLPMPELLPLGFTMLVTSLAAVFFPCRQLLSEMNDPDLRESFIDSSDDAVTGIYFQWPGHGSDGHSSEQEK